MDIVFPQCSLRTDAIKSSLLFSELALFCNSKGPILRNRFEMFSINYRILQD